MVGGRPPKEGVVNFDFTEPMDDFMKNIQRTLVELPDYKGIGGHGIENHGSHGLHSQISIKIGDTSINFRRLL